MEYSAGAPDQPLSLKTQLPITLPPSSPLSHSHSDPISTGTWHHLIVFQRTLRSLSLPPYVLTCMCMYIHKPWENE